MVYMMQLNNILPNWFYNSVTETSHNKLKMLIKFVVAEIFPIFLEEFSTLCQLCSCIHKMYSINLISLQTWFKIRSLLTRTHSPVSIIFLVMSAKYRFLKFTQNCNDENMFLDLLSSNIDSSETAYKTRVCNLLKHETTDSIARKNSLLWRVYLKSLLDVHKDFEKSRNALFAALDECPWNKVIPLMLQFNI